MRAAPGSSHPLMSLCQCLTLITRKLPAPAIVSKYRRRRRDDSIYFCSTKIHTKTGENKLKDFCSVKRGWGAVSCGIKAIRGPFVGLHCKYYCDHRIFLKILLESIMNVKASISINTFTTLSTRRRTIYPVKASPTVNCVFTIHYSIDVKIEKLWQILCILLRARPANDPWLLH